MRHQMKITKLDAYSCQVERFMAIQQHIWVVEFMYKVVLNLNYNPERSSLILLSREQLSNGSTKKEMRK